MDYVVDLYLIVEIQYETFILDIKVLLDIFVIKMPRRKAELLSTMGITINVLTKLLYSITDTFVDSQELKIQHQVILKELIEIVETEYKYCFVKNKMCNSIPWERILEQISKRFSFLNEFKTSDNFTQKEINYMCALMCGVTGKEYEIVTGLKSQYNLSWSIRRKIGMSKNSTNLGLYLKSLAK